MIRGKCNANHRLITQVKVISAIFSHLPQSAALIESSALTKHALQHKAWLPVGRFHKARISQRLLTPLTHYLLPTTLSYEAPPITDYRLLITIHQPRTPQQS